MILLILLSICCISIIYTTLKVGISPMPTWGRLKKDFLAALPPHAPPIIYELGSGFGGLANALSKKYSASQIIGYEKSLVPFFISKLRCFQKHNITLYRKDFLSIDLSDSQMIICYLFPAGMKKLEKKLRKEGRGETLIYTHTFSMNFEKLKEIIASDIHRSKIYVYVHRKKRLLSESFKNIKNHQT